MNGGAINWRPDHIVEPLSWTIGRRNRYVLVLLVFFGYFNLYSLRYNLSIAIIPIAENRNITDTLYLYGGCSSEWTTFERGIVLSACFCGYAIAQLLGGSIVNIFGASNVFVLGILMTLFGSLLTPTMIISENISMFFVVRIMQGLCEGITNIGLHEIWGKWAPRFEKNRLILITISGKNAGIIVGLFGSGILVANTGWESTFYISAFVAYIWFILWLILFEEYPENDKYGCRSSEVDLVRENFKEIEAVSGHSIDYHPWKQIIRSTSVWAIVVANFAQSWGFYTLLTHYPIFLRDMFNFSYEVVGLLSALPFFIFELLMGGAKHIANWALKEGHLNKLEARRFFTCYSFVGQAFFLTLGAFLMDPLWTVISITISVSIGVLAHSGFAINHMDIAPHHAQTILIFSNTFAAFAGIITPILTGFIVQNNTFREWKIVFYISAAMYFYACVFFCVYVSVEEPEWAKILRPTTIMEIHEPNVTSNFGKSKKHQT